MRSTRIDFVVDSGETPEGVLADMMRGFDVEGDVLTACGLNGHAEARVFGEDGELHSFLTEHDYLDDADPIY